MKNILLMIPYGSVGGMERLALNFYTFYKSMGYNVKVIKLIQLQTDIINFEDDEIAFSKKDFFNMSFLYRFYFYLKIPFLVRKAIKKYDIHHTISFGDMCNVFNSLTLTSEHKIASIHALKSVELVTNSFLNIIFKLSYRSTYRKFSKVVCISNAIKIDLIEKCNYKFEKNLKVIYNPHDIERIEKMAIEPLDSIDEEILFKSKVVLFLGRMSVQKAPWHLVKAFKLLSKENHDVKLVLIGDGNLEIIKHLEFLQKHFNLQDKIIFLGRKNNPYKYLQKAKVIALTSYYEGTPNVIVEAIACETPVVSSNCTDGIAELMSDNKSAKSNELIFTESGIITPTFFKGTLDIPNDINFILEEELFAEALQKVILSTDFEESLFTHKKKLLQKFDLQHVCLEYISLH